MWTPRLLWLTGKEASALPTEIFVLEPQVVKLYVQLAWGCHVCREHSCMERTHLCTLIDSPAELSVQDTSAQIPDRWIRLPKILVPSHQVPLTSLSLPRWDIREYEEKQAIPQYSILISDTTQPVAMIQSIFFTTKIWGSLLFSNSIQNRFWWQRKPLPLP